MGADVGDGGLCHVLVPQLHAPRVTWDLWILVKSVVFPTEPPPGAHRGRCDIGDWGLGGAESGFLTVQDALIMQGEHPVCVISNVDGLAHTL